MKDKETGGSAFPVEETADINGKEGMTLRDYFAGQVLSGIITTSTTMESAAKTAYGIADAMIKERNRD